MSAGEDVETRLASWAARLAEVADDDAFLARWGEAWAWATSPGVHDDVARASGGPSGARLREAWSSPHRRAMALLEARETNRLLHGAPAAGALRAHLASDFGRDTYARVAEVVRLVDLSGCRRAVVVGAGPFPASALYLAERTAVPEIEALDVDERAVALASRLVARLGGERVRVVLADGAARDYAGADVVYVANQVRSKAEVLLRVRDTAGPGVRILLREPCGAGRLVAESAADALPEGLEVVATGETHPRFLSRHVVVGRAAPARARDGAAAPPAPLREDALALAARLRRALARALAPLVPEGSRVAYVGAGITNVGDAALAVATREWLRARGCEPWVEADRRTYARRSLARRIGADGVVVVAGGGSLGDVWPSQEGFRQRVLRDFREHRVVQLPQTIRFRAPGAAEAAAAAYRAHPRLSLLVRDPESVVTARNRLGVEATLCPDMAWFLEPPPAPRTSGRVLWLLREDQESTRRTPERTLRPSGVAEAVDWPAARRGAGHGTRRVVARSLRWPLPDLGRRALVRRWDDAEGRARLAAGLALLSGASRVVTDRLHAHILSLLLGVPTVVLPEANGKLRAFHEAWTAGCADVTWCETVADARRLVGS